MEAVNRIRESVLQSLLAFIKAQADGTVIPDPAPLPDLPEDDPRLPLLRQLEAAAAAEAETHTQK
jgi:hypothetical protein